MERGHGGGAHRRTAVVQSTNDAAATSKLWCVNKGYVKEDHVHFFVRRQIRYARWAALRKMVLQCLNTKKTDERKQILSLKAGFDTTYFQLLVQVIRAGFSFLCRKIRYENDWKCIEAYFIFALLREFWLS